MLVRMFGLVTSGNIGCHPPLNCCEDSLIISLSPVHMYSCTRVVAKARANDAFFFCRIPIHPYSAHRL